MINESSLESIELRRDKINVFKFFEFLTGTENSFQRY